MGSGPHKRYDISYFTKNPSILTFPTWRSPPVAPAWTWCPWDEAILCIVRSLLRPNFNSAQLLCFHEIIIVIKAGPAWDQEAKKIYSLSKLAHKIISAFLPVLITYMLCPISRLWNFNDSVAVVKLICMTPYNFVYMPLTHLIRSIIMFAFNGLLQQCPFDSSNHVNNHIFAFDGLLQHAPGVG